MCDPSGGELAAARTPMAPTRCGHKLRSIIREEGAGVPSAPPPHHPQHLVTDLDVFYAAGGVVGVGGDEPEPQAFVLFRSIAAHRLTTVPSPTRSKNVSPVAGSLRETSTTIRSPSRIPGSIEPPCTLMMRRFPGAAAGAACASWPVFRHGLVAQFPGIAPGEFARGLGIAESGAACTPRST